MQQRGVGAFFQEIEDVGGGADVYGEGVTQVGVEIGQAGAVDDYVQSAGEVLLVLRAEAEVRFAAVAGSHFHALAEKLCEFVPVTFGQFFEYWGFLDYALQALQGSVGAIVADEQVDAADFRQIGEEICQPNFSDEACGAYEQDIFFAQRGASREGLGGVARFVGDDRDVHFGRAAFGWFNGFVQDLRVFFEAENGD